MRPPALRKYIIIVIVFFFFLFLHKVLGAVEADRSANRHTECAKLESEISHASLLANAVAAAATVGKMSAVAEQTAKREKALQALNEKVKTDIACHCATFRRGITRKTAKRDEG